ncbi:hypothetical protein [Streptomyces sp. NPDC056682]|uniref:hypothetical protein n=1 Tax=Streptomyces sp. NPDC056682 TaxID=3345909 RepID=UPI00368D5F04
MNQATHAVPHPPPRLDAAEAAHHPEQQQLQLALRHTYFATAFISMTGSTHPDPASHQPPTP